MVDAANTVHIFNRDHLKARRARCADRFFDFDFLFQWAGEQLGGRLGDIKRDFPRVLQIGGRGPALHPDAILMDASADFGAHIIAEEEFMPFANASLDMVISALDLHSVNDLPGTLVQIRRALKPDGLFIAAVPGGETLFELRESLMAAEVAIKGGASPRVFPFADKQQFGALLQRAGFALPVVDSDIVTVTYESMFKLMEDLRGMGESNIIDARSRSFAGRKLFMEAARYYQERFADTDGRIRASFEIIFLIGWAPHESQQKPLAPGSAKTRLADVLGGDEVKTGEKATP